MDRLDLFVKNKHGIGLIRIIGSTFLQFWQKRGNVNIFFR